MSRTAVIACALLLLVACSKREAPPKPAAIGDATRGKAAIDKYGCAACHIIPGIPGANGMVGPTLEHIASRPIIARKVPNKPETLSRWIQNPPAFDPQSAMPNLGITPADAKDITAYLETLK